MTRDTTSRTLLVLALACLAASGCAARIDHRLAEAGAQHAQVDVPPHLVTVAVDDRVLNDSTYVYDGRQQRLFLAPGTHRLQLRYMDVLPESDDRQADDVKLYSEPLTMTATLEAGGRYRLTAPRPEALDAAREFAAKPRIALERTNGGEVVATAAAPSEEPGAPAAGGRDAADPAAMLEYWWQRADPEQRRRFLQRHGD